MTAVVEFDDMTSANEYINNRGLQLYPASPNPAQEKTMLNYGLEQADQVEIQIYDANGKLMKALKHDLVPPGRHQQEIFTFDYSAGTYFYRIATSNGHLMSRFVVQH
jgi:serine protease AprX